MTSKEIHDADDSARKVIAELTSEGEYRKDDLMKLEDLLRGIIGGFKRGNENSDLNGTSDMDITDLISKGIGDFGRRGRGEINFIPGDKGGPCRSFCLVHSTDDWQLNPSHDIRKRVTAYWLNCYNKNSMTTIMSEAWIPSKFKEFKLNVIEPYESVGHNVIFITYDNNGFTLRHF